MVALSPAGQGVQICPVPAEWRKTMIRDDDDSPPPKPARLQKLPLDLLGVEELTDYIAELRQEIARVEEEVVRKQSHRTAADAFFRKPPGS
jgi:uncharacterized small protein (DUF1192 family)